MTVHSKALIALLMICLSACGGGSNAPVTPLPPSTQPLDFSAIGAEVEKAPTSDTSVLIGDETGLLYFYEKGDMPLDRAINVASAAKLVTGLGLWSLIEDGTLSLDSRPADLIPDWTDDPQDRRSQITLSQLGAFTSGFTTPPGGGGCHGVPQ